MSTHQRYWPQANRDQLVDIIDTDLRMCEALSVLFRIEGFQTRFSTGADQFETNLKERGPHAVVLGSGDDIDWMAVLKRVRSGFIGVPVFVLASPNDLDIAVAAMKAGAADVLPKPLNGERLMISVRSVLYQPIRFSGGAAGNVPIKTRAMRDLTPRERQVLELVANGSTNKEAARTLDISPRTVEIHRARIMDKLGARNTADLMRIALLS